MFFICWRGEAGRPAGGAIDAGATVCACFGVGAKTLMAAIGAGTATTVEAIGKLLGAGTNCGSCVPELRQLLTRHARISETVPERVPAPESDAA